MCQNRFAFFQGGVRFAGSPNRNLLCEHRRYLLDRYQLCISLRAVVELLRQLFYLIKFITLFRFFHADLSQRAASVKSTAPVFAATAFRVMDYFLLDPAVKDSAPPSKICNGPRFGILCFKVKFRFVGHLILPSVETCRTTVNIWQGNRFKQSVGNGVKMLFLACGVIMASEFGLLSVHTLRCAVSMVLLMALQRSWHR